MGYRLLLAALVAALLMPLLWGQVEGVPVLIDGKEILRVYGSVGSFTAKDRAAAIEERIETLGKKGFTGTIDVRSIPSERATAVIAGGMIIMAATAVDAETAAMTRDDLARKYAAAIQQALDSYRRNHTWSSFLLASLKTAAAWLIFCVTAWGLWMAIRWLNVRAERSFSRIAAQSGARGLHLLLLERGRAILITFVKFAVALFLISEFSFVISFTFGLFPQTAGISTTLLDYLQSAFGSIGMGIVRYLPSGGFVFVVVVLTHYLLKVLKFLAKEIERGDLPVSGMHPEMARPTFQLVRVTVILFALVVAFPYLPGGQSEAFKGISIFLGLLLSLGSSSAVSNVLAGLVLTYMRPYRAGDRVKIVDTVGDILEKNLLVTRVLTIKNVEVVIPNGAILSNQILNYSALSRTRGLILHTTVTIGYDAPWRLVHELLIRAALKTEGILADPAPFVLETSLNDFHISYELNAYTKLANVMQDLYSGLHQAIQDSFNEGGIEIMSPTFYALRDGNTVTTPADHRPADYEAPSFRVRDTTNDQPAARGHVGD